MIHERSKVIARYQLKVSRTQLFYGEVNRKLSASCLLPSQCMGEIEPFLFQVFCSFLAFFFKRHFIGFFLIVGNLDYDRY